MHDLALAPLSVLPVGPVETIEAAAAAGYRYSGLRIQPVSPTDPVVLGDASLQRAIRKALADTGVRLLDIEVFRVGPQLDVESLVPAMAFGAECGARHMLCTFPLRTEGTPADEDATVERLVQLCERAQAFGLRPMLEFMKYRLVGTLDDATRVVAKAGHPNLGICVDALHLSRSGGTPDAVRGIDANLLPYCQLCDAPSAIPSDEEIPLEARYRRMSPGTGGLPLAELLQMLPDDVVLSIEVPDNTRTTTSAPAIAEQLARDTEALVATIGRKVSRHAPPR